MQISKIILHLLSNDSFIGGIFAPLNENSLKAGSEVPVVEEAGRGEVISLIGRLASFFSALNVDCPLSGECCKTHLPRNLMEKGKDNYSEEEEKRGFLSLFFWPAITVSREIASCTLTTRYISTGLKLCSSTGRLSNLMETLLLLIENH